MDTRRQGKKESAYGEERYSSGAKSCWNGGERERRKTPTKGERVALENARDERWSNEEAEGTQRRRERVGEKAGNAKEGERAVAREWEKLWCNDAKVERRTGQRR